MQLPDDVLNHIKSFIKVTLRTKHQWIEFYLEKTPPLRYEVGMTFKINNRLHIITVIEPTHMITHIINNTKYGLIWPICYGDIFRYKNLEYYLNFPWTNLVDDSISSKKKIYITNALNYIKKNNLLREVIL